MTRYRGLLKGVLLTFVVFTAGYAVGKEVGVRRALAHLPTGGPSSAAASGALAAPGETTAPRRRLVARYYHGTKRCVTCNKIEAYAKEALESRFAEDLASGRILWETANMDEIWNADAVRRYGLIRSSLVFLDVEDGEEKDYSVLQRAWDLVGEKDRFFDYVQSEVEMITDGWDAPDEEE